VTWVNGTTGLSGVVSASNSLVGTTDNDAVGNLGVTVLRNGNYVVASDGWNNGILYGHFGAATWGNGNSGIVGPVSASNSLVGTAVDDYVSYYGLIALSNGNYVVVSDNWHQVGAVTWGNGSTGITGPVSASNSLTGTTAGDSVGDYGITALSNGNYVVRSPYWNSSAGAVTWGNGNTGITGSVSAANSLIGAASGDSVGGGDAADVTALSNSNYLVVSPHWNNNSGAVTWGSGSTGITGPVSTLNSLYGATVGDSVGNDPSSPGAITPLVNGNYVVRSPAWNNGVSNSSFGAVTWGNGTTGTTGPVSASNSLIGTTAYDNVGSSVTALSNGNYVVVSQFWNNGVAGSNFGAATWGNGSTGIIGPVSASNSLIGTTTHDFLGIVTALSNGNYVVANRNNGFGAVTWGNGSNGITGTVSASNSLIGTSVNDLVDGPVTALSNGNYVVASSNWSNGFGAATWGNGYSGIVGSVSASNSLIGATANDHVGSEGIFALSNGNYVVLSGSWNNGVPGSYFGAATWGNGSTGIAGPVSAGNSLIGATTYDYIGHSGLVSLSDGNYVVFSDYWSGKLGAVTLGSDAFRLKGTIQSWNSVVGNAANGGASMTFSYDPSRHTLVVGRQAENIVSLFSMDQIFAGDFEQ
jgi:hypothetical protein